jgi:hypothetical protein
MTTQNQFDKDARVSTAPKDDAAKSPDIKRELTDQELASVAGGTKYGGPTQTKSLLQSQKHDVT